MARVIGRNLLSKLVDYEKKNIYFAMPRTPRPIDACPHTDRPHYSGGRCKSCYHKARSDQGLYDRAASDAKYAQSEEGKERAKRYNQTEGGKARKRKWRRGQKTAAPKNPA